MAIAWGSSDTVMHFDFNTYIGYSATTMDILCSASDCSSGTKTLRNNIFIGYPRDGYDGNQKPGMIYYPTGLSDSFWTARSNNIFFNMRNCPAITSSNENCNNPLLTSVPPFDAPLTSESPFDMENLDFHLLLGSPARNAGILVDAVTGDFSGSQRANPPNLGAYE
jgi:hypothetical protein